MTDSASKGLDSSGSLAMHAACVGNPYPDRPSSTADATGRERRHDIEWINSLTPAERTGNLLHISLLESEKYTGFLMG